MVLALMKASMPPKSPEGRAWRGPLVGSIAPMSEHVAHRYGPKTLGGAVPKEKLLGGKEGSPRKQGTKEANARASDSVSKCLRIHPAKDSPRVTIGDAASFSNSHLVSSSGTAFFCDALPLRNGALHARTRCLKLCSK